MKTGFLLIVSTLLLTFCFSSCMENLRIEKRQYRNGFYFASAQERHRTSTADTLIVTRDETYSAHPQENIRDRSTDSVVAGNAQSAVDSAAAINSPVKPTADTDSVITQSEMQYEKSHTTQQADVPAEAKGLNTMWWISLAMLVVGAVGAVVAFMPAVTAGFIVLIGIAPILIVAALVLSLIVMTTAKRRMQAAGSNDLRSYYDQLRKRARLIAILAGSAIVLFVLFLLLIIIALSNFQ
jgi:hypothetical protein